MAHRVPGKNLPTMRRMRLPDLSDPSTRRAWRSPRQGNRARPHRRCARIERGGSGRRRQGRRRGPALRSFRSSCAPSSATTLWIPPYRRERWRVYYIPPPREEDRTVNLLRRDYCWAYGFLLSLWAYGLGAYSTFTLQAFGPKLY